MKAAKPKKPKQDIIIEVDVRKLVRFAVLLLMIFLCVFCLIFCVRRFLTVQKFSMSGISEYELEEIVAASGVKRGDRWVSLDSQEIAQNVCDGCPYVAWVKVSFRFPNQLHFSVEGKLGVWYIEVEDRKYSLDPELVVITDTENTDGMTKLILPNLQSAIAGELPVFGESQTELKKTLELVSMIRESPLKGRLTLVDLSDRTNIALEIDGRYRALLGDSSNFEAKIGEIMMILSQEAVKNSVGGEINVTVPGHSGFRPSSSAAEGSNS